MPKKSTELKTRFSIRASAEDRGLIDRAAKALGKSRSAFMVDTARREAQDVLMDQTHFVLDTKQWDAFIAELEKAPKDNPRLRELMARKAPWEQ